jgi:hypothetical protein
MTIKPAMITCDTTDATRIGRWWAERTGGSVVAENDGWFVLVAVPDGPTLAFQKVGDPTPGKNRLHVDFTSDDLDAAKADLLGVGAGHVHDQDVDGFRWSTFTDPDGNQFCVSGPADHLPGQE